MTNYPTTTTTPPKRLSFLLVLSLLFTLVGCFRTSAPPSLQTLAGETFDVYRDGTSSTYHADSTSTSQSYTGALKDVVEDATHYLVANGGGTINFLAGDFDLGSDWLEWYDITNVVFTGQGIDVTVLRNSSSASTDTEPFDCTRCDGITIKDMTISAGGPDRSTSDALDFDGGDNNLIERIKITDSRSKGIVFDGKGDPSEGLGTADNNTVRDCIIEGSAIPSDGIQLLASSNNLIEGCTITNVGGSGIYANKGSSSADQPNKPSNDNTLRNNHVENSGRDGIKINSGSNNIVTGNTILNSSDDVTGLDGIRMVSYNQVDCDDNIIEFNMATDNQNPKTQKYGLKIVSSECHRTVVRDNDFAGNLVGDVFDGGTNTIFTSSDTEAPTQPTNLTATATTATQVDLSWTASTDNIAVTGYEIWRDGSALTAVGAVTSYADTSVQPDTTYSYQVRATDAAGNWSTFSNAAGVTTPDATILTFTPSDDSYIRADQPNNSFGGSTSLRVDGSPVHEALVKFSVTGVSGDVANAVLRLYNTNSASLGGYLYAVTDSSWSEGSVTWNNAPASGGLLGSLGTVSPGNWYEVDVTSLVNGDGLVSIKITSDQSNGAFYSSKEGSNAPQLVVTFTDNGSGNSRPVADPQSVTTSQGLAVDITLTGSDSDGDCNLTFAVATPPSNGTLGSISNEQCSAGSGSAQITYTPGSGFIGSDSFTFEVTDPSSATSSPATVNISVDPSSVTFTPVHDSYVRDTRPDNNYGSATTLRADGSPVQDILMTFDVDVGGATVSGATLRLYNVNSATLGGNFYEVTDTSWDEATVTWNTAPAASPTSFASLGTVKPGNWYEVDVSAVVSGNGLVSFKVSSTSANGAFYSSKEDGSGFAPELVVTTQ